MLKHFFPHTAGESVCFLCPSVLKHMEQQQDLSIFFPFYIRCETIYCHFKPTQQSLP